MKIAIEGCAHGELEQIYDTIQEIEKLHNIKVDLLLCCGDFQSTRNLGDLQTMAVPKKHQSICTFYKYYSGECVAPILTIFIGGNHEASNYLQELPYGGWVAPNIYYLGYAGVVRVNGIRIAGISGIYKEHDFSRGRFEFSPFNDSTRRSVYHIRQLEVFRLKQLSNSIDIFLSHDWPRGIYNYGNKEQLVRFKPHFREEVKNNQLGSKPCEDLLKALRPSYWFAAHLHCKFAAVVPHFRQNKAEKVDIKPDQVTKFLALDKCLPKRRFLQILDITSTNENNTNGELKFEYDLEWLSILALTNHLINVNENKYNIPTSTMERPNYTPKKEELEHIKKKFKGDLSIPKNFCQTVEPYTPNNLNNMYIEQPKAIINPQASHFCDTLGIDDPLMLALLMGKHELNYYNIHISDNIPRSDSPSVYPLISQVNILDTPEDNLGINLPKPILNSPSSNCMLATLLDRELISVSRMEQSTKPIYECETSITLGTTQEKNTLQSANSCIDMADFDLNTSAEAKCNELTPPNKKFKRRNQIFYKDEESTD